MKKLVLAVLGILFFAGTSHAQSVEPAIGYSFLRLGGSNGVNQNGGSGSLSGQPNRPLRLGGGVGASPRFASGGLLDTHNLLFCPPPSLPHPAHTYPFAPTP